MAWKRMQSRTPAAIFVSCLLMVLFATVCSAPLPGNEDAASGSRRRQDSGQTFRKRTYKILADGSSGDVTTTSLGLMEGNVTLRNITTLRTWVIKDQYNCSYCNMTQQDFAIAVGNRSHNVTEIFVTCLPQDGLPGPNVSAIYNWNGDGAEIGRPTNPEAWKVECATPRNPQRGPGQARIEPLAKANRGRLPTSSIHGLEE